MPCGKVATFMALLQTLLCTFCARPPTATIHTLGSRSLFFSFPFLFTFPTFSCMACSGELPLTYVQSRHIAAISGRFCCQAQSQDQIFSVLLQQTNPLLVPGGAASHNPQSKVVVALQVNWSVTTLHVICRQHNTVQSKAVLAATQMTVWDLFYLACLVQFAHKGSCPVQLGHSVCLEMSKQLMGQHHWLSI